MRVAAALLLFISGGFPGHVCAHELSTGFLLVNHSSDNVYAITWKTPLSADKMELARPQFPADCVELPGSLKSAQGLLEWKMTCKQPLTGRSIQLAAMNDGLSELLVQVTSAGGELNSQRLLAGQDRFEVPASPGTVDTMKNYMVLGIEHILLGMDHLMFVLLLIVFVDGLWALVKTVTAFTVAHSITLAAAAMGYVNVPVAPVESIIALSILFLATELARKHHLTPDRATLSMKYPWLVVFIFGLLHGLGFAGALAEVGLPENYFVLALLFFNLGIEIGQLLFIASVIIVGRSIHSLLARRVEAQWEMVMVYVVGGISCYWFIDRVTADYLNVWV
jgi:hydrogenase/urease accessory protein HupE